MATLGSRYCIDCSESTHASCSKREISRFFALNVSISEVDAEVLDGLTKSLCSHCGQTGEILQPRDTYSHLFATNRPFLEAEEEVISVRLQAAKQKSSAVEELILAAEDLLKELKGSRETLSICISQCTQLLSPIRRLPRDVLLEIIKFAIAGSVQGDTLNIQTGLWPLSHVCSSWRKAIISTPILWSDINIDGFPPCYGAPILNECIKRSQSTPLDIVFRSGKAELSKILFQILCSQSDRWKSLKLFIDPGHWPYLNQIRYTLIQLRSLSLGVSTSDADVTWDDDFFAFSPALESIELGMEEDTYGPPPIPLKLPDGPIVDFSIWLSSALYSRIHDIIPHSVETLVVGVDNPQSSVALTRMPEIYPSLECARVANAPWLLDAITCPKLVHLRLQDMRISTELISHLQPFLNRSVQSHGLFDLHIIDLSIPSGAPVSEFWRTTNFATSLRVTYEDGEREEANVSRQISKLLSPLVLTTNQSNELLSSLSTLIFEFENFKPTPSLYRLIHSLVESRRNPPAGYAGRKLLTLEFRDGLSESNGRLITIDNCDQLVERAEGR